VESTLESPSAPAKVVENPRDDLLEIFKKGNHFGGELAPENYTFCSCCGAQFLKANGTIPNSGLSGDCGPSKEDVEVYYENRYGSQWRERISYDGQRAAELMVAKNARRNKPGVTFAFMELNKAIELLFDEEHRHLADGYEIKDEDQGRTCSVVWMNA